MSPRRNENATKGKRKSKPKQKRASTPGVSRIRRVRRGGATSRGRR